jgi:hypothetical protein
MKILKSKKLDLPQVFFVSDRSEIKDVPIGVPFIFGDASMEYKLVKILEYEVLYQAAVKSGYPFNFRQILLDNGYKDLKYYGYGDSAYMDYSTGSDFDGMCDYDLNIKLSKLGDSIEGMFKEYLNDSSAYVDLEKLKGLNVFPVWLNTIEEAVHTNIHNFSVYNPNMYNKKLEGMYGSLDLSSPSKNLIIIDISGSIPKAVSSTCLALAKNLAETFYADLMITGSKTTMYEYENIHTLNIETIYEENGMNNDQVWFKKIVSQDERSYKTAIVFGDNDSPCNAWRNTKSKFILKGATETQISRGDGKKLCKWKIDKLISFHTRGTDHIAAYGEWFEPIETERIEDWVKYL